MEQAHGTSTTGNTSRCCAKRRNYIITFWTKEYPKELPTNVTYLATCEDTTKKGKYHGHAFIYFKNPCGLKSVKKLFGNDCHVEIPSNNEDCINYILDKTKRKHNFQEYGIRPMNNGIKRTIKELKTIDNPDNLDWRQFNIWQKINDIKNHEIDDIDEVHKEIKVYYIQGPSGCGKTERAKQIIREYKKEHPDYKINFYLKYENGFYNGATGAKIGCYDDFRDSHMKASEFINLIDYNKHVMNIKGGSVMNNYELLIITSIQPLDELYKNIGAEPAKQWTRRVEVINMYLKNQSDEIDDI